MKSSLPKLEPKIVHYRNYKKFDNLNFRNELLYRISEIGFQNVDSACFENIFLTTLDMHAPLKTKYLRANNSPFMTKDLSKAIMVRSRLKNKSLKLKTLEAREQYKKQRNLCVSLLRSTKSKFYENLDPKLITDNKKFWKKVKPFFSDKSDKNTNIILEENEIIVTEPEKCADIFNNYFITAIETLDIDRSLYTDNSVCDNDSI